MKFLINILKTVFCISLLVVGFLIGKFTDFPNFKISRSIDLVNISSIVVTILLAFVISVFFSKKKSDNRVEKDLILRKVDNIYEITNELQKKSISGQIHYTNAASSIKRINTSIQSIYRTVEKCQFSIKDDIKSSIKDSIIELRDILTNTPKVTEDQIEKIDLPIEVKSGVIMFNRQRINQIEAKFDNLKDSLLELEIRINKK